MNHNLVRIPRQGYRCTICEWFWRSKPAGTCPGVKRYAWGEAPENLKTEAQLRKLGRKPAVNPESRFGSLLAAGYVQHNGRGDKINHYLYDVNISVPMTAEEIDAAKPKRKGAQR